MKTNNHWNWDCGRGGRCVFGNVAAGRPEQDASAVKAMRRGQRSDMKQILAKAN